MTTPGVALVGTIGLLEEVVEMAQTPNWIMLLVLKHFKVNCRFQGLYININE